MIILYENKNKDIINILIDEINKMKEINNKQNEKINELIKLNENKDIKINNLENIYNILIKANQNKVIQINNLENKYNELKEQLNIINDTKKEKDINLIYECQNEGNQKIFGEIFVKNNKNNIDLIIDEKKLI